ncbi:sugar ABC transporter substrate-binding protein [uncultured Sphaerochaeta sp.]|uniref:ABC transporter substrate-binding protein n=1 Tax=uncultured Sphaerochaeta sp. TaxID=886478 RepID=UPI002A0A1BE9|nr:sugar ABC transporter substrate-binding protein [uncultured Sphaerochaeta sp.]
MKRFACVLFLLLSVTFLGFSNGTKEPVTPKDNSSLPYKGVDLTVAVCAEQYADYLNQLAKSFNEKTGANVKVDVIGYVELYQKITQDYASGTKLYDLATVDIMWSGEFAQKGYTMDLTDLIAKDKTEINTDDIIPVMWKIGSWDGKQIAYPMAGYANSLIYRKDLIEDPTEQKNFKAKYGYDLTVPTTLTQLKDIAQFFTRPDQNLYGLVANGARGSAVAQDWMEYMRAFGGSLFDKDGKVSINSKEAKASLEFFVSIFDKYAPPGAIGYWWDDRETSYRIGQSAMESSWSIARAGYEDPEISKVVGKTGMTALPKIETKDSLYGVGGWGIGINNDIDAQKKDASWAFIKYITSQAEQKEWMMHDGAPIRYSTLNDPELLKAKPWLPEMLNVFVNGDGDYRPRGPQATEIQNMLGLRVNQAITHELTVDEALKAAEKDLIAIMQ